MTESERLKLHIWSLDESRDGPAMAELRHVIAGMVEPSSPYFNYRRYLRLTDRYLQAVPSDLKPQCYGLDSQQVLGPQAVGQKCLPIPPSPFGNIFDLHRRYESD